MNTFWLDWSIVAASALIAGILVTLLVQTVAGVFNITPDKAARALGKEAIRRRKIPVERTTARLRGELEAGRGAR